MGEFIKRSRAVIYLQRAIKEYEQGQPERAWEPAQAGMRIFEALEAGPSQRRDLAKACQLSGNIQLALGKPDDALGWYTRAEDLYKQDQRSREDYGRFLHDTAIVFMGFGTRNFALDYAKRSLDLLKPFGEHYIHHIQELIYDIESEDLTPDTAVESRLQQRRADVLNARGAADVARYSQSLVFELLTSGQAAENLVELHSALHVAFNYSWKERNLQHCLNIIGALDDLYFTGLPLPAWSESAALDLVDLAARGTNLDWISQAHGVHATTLIAQYRYTDALMHALTAVARHDEFALQTESSAIRLLTSQPSTTARQIALEAAVELQDTALAAELIESARLQVLPDSQRIDTGLHYTGSSITGLIRDIAPGSLTHLRAVAVGGRSRIRAFYSTGTCDGETQLEHVIDAVGGPTASWWGTWVANARVYWCVFFDGKSFCGKIDLAEGSMLHKLMIESHQASLRNSNAKTEEILAGPWCRNYLAEERLSVELGRLLVPEPLQKHFASLDPKPVAPCSIVLAGNLFPLLPLPLLGLPLQTQKGFVARLIEIATLRIAPPAILVDHILSYPIHDSNTYPVTVACVDPRGDLPHSRKIPHGSAVELSGSPSAGQRLADRNTLVAALARTEASAPGIFYYSGHFVADGRGGDLEDGLALANDEVLDARSIFTAAKDGRPAIPFPVRGMVAACESAGAGGSGAGEWLGISASMLWAGSRQIVATNWKIWDTVFTSRFDLSLIHTLRNSHDVAASLRELQIESLDEWRKYDHDFSLLNLDGLPAQYVGIPLPLIWGAYCCIGVVR